MKLVGCWRNIFVRKAHMHVNFYLRALRKGEISFILLCYVKSLRNMSHPLRTSRNILHST